MITLEYPKTMVRYNHWQNNSLIGAASTLRDEQRRADLGLFWGDIFSTFNHILWADHIWMDRFAPHYEIKVPSHENSTKIHKSWEAFMIARAAVDNVISKWAGDLKQEDIEGNLIWYSGLSQKQMEEDKGLLIVHFFNHQIHHRGQIHAGLTHFEAKPEATDLPWIPEQA